MSKRGSLNKANALPDLPLMAVLVEHVEGGRAYIINKSIVHLSDEAIKNVYKITINWCIFFPADIFYIMFTCWGCLFFGSMKVWIYVSHLAAVSFSMCLLFFVYTHAHTHEQKVGF
ncbi:hypothetical protein UlMin_014621 [Ulmus minor]